jgi:hypothetical protein
MAWIEQTGQHTWRVRYPQGDGHSHYGTVSGFTTSKAARDYANDLESDRHRGQWIDPAAANITASAWSAMWVETLDVETRRGELPLLPAQPHPAPLGSHRPRGDHRPRRHHMAQGPAQTLRRLHRRRHPHRVLHDARRRRQPTPHPHQPRPPATPPWPATRPLPHPRRESLRHARTRHTHRRTSRHSRRPLRRPTRHHRRLDRLPLGRTRRPPTRPRPPRPRRHRHRPRDRRPTRIRPRTLARTTQDPRLSPHHHTATIPRRTPTRPPRHHHRLVRVHQPTRLPTTPKHLRPPRVPTRRRWQPPKGNPSDPPWPHMPRSSAQSQDVVDRRPHSRDRTGPTPRTPPSQPTRRGLQPRRPGDRNRTPQEPGTPLVLRPPNPPAHGQPTPSYTTDTQVSTTCTPQRSRATHHQQTPTPTGSATAHRPATRWDDHQTGGKNPPEFLHPGAPERSTSTPDHTDRVHEKSPPTRRNASIERL